MITRQPCFYGEIHWYDSTLGPRPQGWLAWGLSSAAGYLGYVPGDGEAAGKLLDAPSEADIRDLYTALELDAQGLPPPGEQAPASKAGWMVYQLQARACEACGLVLVHCGTFGASAWPVVDRSM